MYIYKILFIALLSIITC